MFAVTTIAGRVLRISPHRARIEIDPPDIAGRFAGGRAPPWVTDWRSCHRQGRPRSWQPPTRPFLMPARVLSRGRARPDTGIVIVPNLGGRSVFEQPLNEPAALSHRNMAFAPPDELVRKLDQHLRGRHFHAPRGATITLSISITGQRTAMAARLARYRAYPLWEAGTSGKAINLDLLPCGFS